MSILPKAARSRQLSNSEILRNLRSLAEKVLSIKYQIEILENDQKSLEQEYEDALSLIDLYDDVQDQISGIIVKSIRTDNPIEQPPDGVYREAWEWVKNAISEGDSNDG